MADRPVPSEAAVRELVERALARLEGGAGAPAAAAAAAAGTGSGPAVPGVPAAGGPPGGPPGGRSVAVGADHGGFALKEAVARHLAEAGWGVTDCGTNGTEAVDYPDFAHVVARLVATGSCAAGIVVDGAGIGSAMAANKVPGVRAANAHDTSMARNAREHNHANVLTLGARMVGEGLALEIVDVFLGTPWEPGRHAQRVAKITGIEERYSRAQAEEPGR